MLREDIDMGYESSAHRYCWQGREAHPLVGVRHIDLLRLAWPDMTSPHLDFTAGGRTLKPGMGCGGRTAPAQQLDLTPSSGAGIGTRSIPAASNPDNGAGLSSGPADMPRRKARAQRKGPKVRLRPASERPQAAGRHSGPSPVWHRFHVASTTPSLRC